MRRALLLAVLATSGCGGDGEPAAEFTNRQELGTRTSVDVAFESRGATLRGRLELPAVDGPHPVVVWVHGSGDERLDEGSSFYTEYLDRRFAVFKYERSPKEATSFEETAEDVVAAVKAVRSHDEAEADGVGLMALGVGGWIAPIAADRSTAISFAVILSGPAVSVGEENLFEQLTGAFECGPTGIPMAEVRRRVNAEPPSHFDPRPYLARLDIPVLWLYGDRDTQQPVAKDLGVLEALRAEGKGFETVVFPTANHELFVSKTGTCWEGRRGGGVVPGFGPAVNRWLREHVA